MIGNSIFSCLLIVSYEFDQVCKDNQSIVDSKRILSIIILYNTSYNLPLGEFSENGMRQDEAPRGILLRLQIFFLNQQFITQGLQADWQIQHIYLYNGTLINKKEKGKRKRLRRHGTAPLGLCLVKTSTIVKTECHDLAKWLSHYLYFFWTYLS